MQKPEVMEVNGFGEKLCAPSSIQRYMDASDRTSGLGGTSRSLSLFFHFFIFFVRTDVAQAYRVQFLRYRDESLQAHCPRRGIVTSKKILGVGPPWGKFFSQIFPPNFDLKM